MKTIYIVDYGSQFAFLIGRRLRSELGVWCEIIHPTALSSNNIQNIGGIILSGGPKSVSGDNEIENDAVSRIINDPTIPVLGICYGMQMMAKCLGGRVEKGQHGEYGSATIEIDPVFSHIFGFTKTASLHAFELTKTETETVWMSHQDVVIDAGIGSTVIATSNAGIAAMINTDKRCFAVQFHPEVTHTKCGIDVLRYFVTSVCTAIPLNTWNNATRFEKCKEIIHSIVVPGEDFVVLGLSGGVDSMVTAALLSKILDASLWRAIYIDFGTMREGETVRVQYWCQQLGIPLHVISKHDECLRALIGVTDPERKRKIMGELFANTFKDAYGAREPTVLCQGTIYPDVIESGGGKADVIKSHHNVGGLPKNYKLKILEPLRWFFKDEVRLLGAELGLPPDVINCHPFPGPGLTVRIIGEVTQEKLTTVRRADHIFMNKIRQAGLYNRISQAYAGMLEGKSVGVVGDQRRYGNIIVLRAVCTDDFMTANIYPFDCVWLESVATEIINQCSSVARVMFDVTSKPPGTIELE